MDNLSVSAGHIGHIPVRNLWLLMLYASDLFRSGKTGNIGLEDSPDELPDLIAEILCHAVEIRQRRHLSFGYRRRNAIVNRVRGRIDILTTERNQLLARGLVACQFDELSIDTPRNRFVRAALERIASVVHRKDLSHRCLHLADGMKNQGVSGITPTNNEMRTDTFSRNDANDQYMVAAAKLAFEFALPNEAMGTNMLSLPDREEAWVRRLFERAIAGFYDVVLSPKGWHVQRGIILNWQIEQKTSGIDAILPSMRTDMMLDHTLTGRRLVIDTKFTSILSPGWYREESLRSSYVYQIYAYLRSQAGRGDLLADRASGMLLHPCVGDMIDETVIIQGHSIRFATVDLTATPSEIRGQLLQFCA